MAAVEDNTNSLDVWTFREAPPSVVGSHSELVKGSDSVDGNDITTIGLPSGSQPGTSPITSHVNSSTSALAATAQSAGIDQLLTVTQESDVASTFFSRRRSWDLA